MHHQELSPANPEKPFGCSLTTTQRRRIDEPVHLGKRYTAMAEINLIAAFTTVPGGEADAIKELLTDTIQQIA